MYNLFYGAAIDVIDTNIFSTMCTEEDFNLYSVDVDADCVNQDFDDYDLYGEIMEEDGGDTDVLLE